MMYGNKLATAIKVNGKVLREFKDTVYIPYGSEYTILIKNLHTQKAVVNVYIDGNDTVPNGLVINAGQEINLERSIKNNNLTEGNRFKFVERTSAVEQHRGIRLEDGLVRIEHQFELPPVYNNMWYSNNITNAVMRGHTWATTNSPVSSSATYSSVSPQSLNDAGITVPGSRSDQRFQTISVGALDPSRHSMVIRLLGDLGNNAPVTKPVTVKHRPKCVTCSKQNKAAAKFCTECGTALEIFA